MLCQLEYFSEIRIMLADNVALNLLHLVLMCPPDPSAGCLGGGYNFSD